MTPASPGHGRIERDGGECERLIAAPEARRRVALVNVRRAAPPPPDHFQAQIVDGLAILERFLAVLETLAPLAQCVRRGAERPQGPAGPPNVAAGSSEGERARSPLRLPLPSPRRGINVGGGGGRPGPPVGDGGGGGGG